MMKQKQLWIVGALFFATCLIAKTVVDYDRSVNFAN